MILSGLGKELSRFVNARDPERDAVIIAFVAVAVAGIGWLTYEVVVHRCITAAFGDTFKALCAFVGVGGPLKGVADKLLPTPPPAPPTPPGDAQ